MASRSTSPGHLRPPKVSVSRSSLMVTKLPSDFDILRLRPARSRYASRHLPSHACRARNAIARSRSHDAGRSGPARRHGCRRFRRDSARSWLSIRYASPDGRDPGAIPAGFVVAGLLPQHEVARVLLVGIDRNARTRCCSSSGRLESWRNRPSTWCRTALRLPPHRHGHARSASR